MDMLIDIPINKPYSQNYKKNISKQTKKTQANCTLAKCGVKQYQEKFSIGHTSTSD